MRCYIAGFLLSLRSVAMICFFSFTRTVYGNFTLSRVKTSLLLPAYFQRVIKLSGNCTKFQIVWFGHVVTF